MANLSAVTLLQYLTDGLYIVIFLVVAAHFIRRHRRADLDVTLLFGASALLIAVSLVTPAFPDTVRPIVGVASSILLMALPYLLLRLVDDFAGVPTTVMRLAEIGLAISIVGLVVISMPYPLSLVGPLVIYFVALEIYGSSAFVVAAGRSRGVTRRRMQAVAIGSLFVGLDILAAGMQAALPAIAPFWESVSAICAVASALAYYAGFALPSWLRQAWQAPELRAAMHGSSSLIRTPNDVDVINELERATADAVGASHALITIWDPKARAFQMASGAPSDPSSIEGVAVRRAFTTQKPFTSTDLESKTRRQFESEDRRAALAAPITIDKKSIGVLLVTASRAPIFADEDLELLQILADRAAVILENRTLIAETAGALARVEALAAQEEERRRLNAELELRVVERTSELERALGDLESFSYSVSHDLRAPLRTIDGFSQALLEDCFDELSSEGQDWLQRIRSASRRMGDLIDGLLRLSRVSRSEFHSETVDLSALAQSIAVDLHRTDADRSVDFVIEEGLIVEGDQQLLRIGLDNLLANAWKFTSTRDRARIELSATVDDGHTVYCVRDNGVGFDMAYVDKLFGPFQRLHRRDEFDGMGIGLATVQRIIRRHAGRIWATSTVDEGASFCFTIGTESGSG